MSDVNLNTKKSRHAMVQGLTAALEKSINSDSLDQRMYRSKKQS
jgi:hypothetical protein